MILILFVAPSAPRFRTRGEAFWIRAALIALALARLRVLESAWLGAQKIYAEDLAILERARPGASIAVAHRINSIKFSAAPELHMPLMATVRRDASIISSSLA